jgi:hypothetical protein
MDDQRHASDHGKSEPRQDSYEVDNPVDPSAAQVIAS